MRTDRHYHPSARNALWVGGMLVVLAGLFGMHGLQSHGAAGMGSITAAPMSHSALHVGGHADADTSVAVLDAGTSMDTRAVAAGHPLMDMVMAGMCLAFLAAGLMALLRILNGNRFSPILWVVARPMPARSRTGREPDPPSLFGLSIQRC